MKILLTTLALALSIGGCSSSNNDDKSGANTPFGKLSAGEWVSACQQDGEGNYKETLILKNGSGTSTYTYYQNANCTGTVVKTNPPDNFSYSIEQKAGGKDGEAKITITDGRQSKKVDAVIQDNLLIITDEGQTVIYQRVGGTDVISKPEQGISEMGRLMSWRAAIGSPEIASKFKPAAALTIKCSRSTEMAARYRSTTSTRIYNVRVRQRRNNVRISFTKLIDSPTGVDSLQSMIARSSTSLFRATK